MSKNNNQQEYHRNLNELAYAISRRFRRPITTMLGLVELMRLRLLKDEEQDLMIKSFQACLDELDKFSKELNLLIHRERKRVDE